jgi:hypothetical protein
VWFKRERPKYIFLVVNIPGLLFLQGRTSVDNVIFYENRFIVLQSLFTFLSQEVVKTDVKTFAFAF